MMMCRTLVQTDMVLTRVMNMRKARTYPHPTSPTHTVHVYEMGPGGPAAELHVAESARPAPCAAGRGKRASRRLPDA